MPIISESDVPEEHRRSPKGDYELYRRHISIALGGVPHRGAWGGGHAFDIELTRLPPGKRNFPFHAHAAQAEHYIILQGDGCLRSAAGEAPLRAGDHVYCAPGEPHQIRNVSATDDLVYYVIADHPAVDITTYPDSDKRQLKPEMRICRVEEASYYDGEE